METMVKLQAANSVLMGVESVRQVLEKESILVQKLTAFWTNVNTKALNIQAKAKKKDIAVTGIVTAAQWAWNAAIAANPVMLIVVAIAALVAGLAALAIALSDTGDEFDEAAVKQEAFNEAVKEAQLNTVEQKVNLRSLIAVAKDETASLEARQQALKELNKISPEYFNNLTLENVATEEGQKLLDDYVRALNDKAEAEAVSAKLTELAKQELELKNTTLAENLSWTDAIALGLDYLVDSEAAVAEAEKQATAAKEEKIAALQKERKAIEDLLKQQEEERLANEAAEEAARKALKEQEDAEKKAEQERKKRADERKKAREKEQADAKKAEEERIQNLIASQEFADALVIEMMKDGQEKEEAQRIAAYEKQIGDLEKNGQLTAEISKNLETQLINDLDQIREKHETERLEKEKERIQKQNDLRIELMKEGVEKEIEASKLALEVRLQTLEEENLLTQEVKKRLEEQNEAELEEIRKRWREKDTKATEEAEKKKQEARKQSLDNAATAIQGLATINNSITEAQLNAAGDDEKKKEQIRKKSFEREKKLNIAMALINGAQSIAAAIATGPPQGYVFAAINAGIMAAQIAAIASAKYEGSGGSTSVAAPNTSGLNVGEQTAETTGNANQDTITDTSTLLGGQEGEGVPTKVFVSAVDISNVQSTTEKIDTIGTVGE
jgi:tubulin-specific chaperone A